MCGFENSLRSIMTRYRITPILPVNAVMPIIHRHIRNISFFIKSEHEENASCFGSQFSSLTNKGLKQQNVYESVNSFFNLLRVVNISKSNVSILYGLNRLKILNLKGNYLLETLEAGTFLSLANVKDLEIVGTKIFRLKPDTFNGLDQLQYLNISRNKITIVEKYCFSGLTNLTDLDIITSQRCNANYPQTYA
jgi:Leucine-rich repeat (LRR) protein